MKDVFFYRDPLTGRRKPTSVLWAVVVALAVVGVVYGVLAYVLATRPTYPTPGPLPPTATPTLTPTVTPTPTATPTWTPVPTQDPVAARIRARLEAIAQCPRDINAWEWEYMIDPGSPASRVIRTQCVRDNFLRTLAWNYALGLGWNRDEITSYLGFDDYPILFPASGSKTPFRTDAKVFSTDVDVYSPATYFPNMRQWYVDENGNLRKVVYLVKCYPAEVVLGGRKRSFAELFDAPFTAQCLVQTWLELKEVYAVAQLPDGKVVSTVLTREGKGNIYRELFAYLPDKNLWVYQGTVHDKRWVKPIAGELAALQEGLYEAYRQDDAYFEGAFLMEYWGLDPKPLPESWKDTLVSLEEFLEYQRPWIADGKALRTEYSWPYSNP